MNTSNYNLNEDAVDDPLFVRFSKVFEDTSLYRLNNKIRKFEASHFHLTLVSVDDFTKIIPVTGEYLFSDRSYRYSELVYKFTLYREIRYYEPDPKLVEWLTKLDEFAKSRRNPNGIMATG